MSKKQVNKRAVVLSYGFDVPAKDIVAAEKAKGVKIQETYVYVVRSNERNKIKGNRGPSNVIQKLAKAGQIKPTNSLAKYRAMVLEVGVDVAKKELEYVENGLQSIVNG